MAQPGDMINTGFMVVFLLIFIVLFIYFAVALYRRFTGGGKDFSPAKSRGRSKLNKVKNANLSLHI